MRKAKKKTGIELPKKERGIYKKFQVFRADGADVPGGKHGNCEYFVLDLTHDPFAGAALRAYAEVCQKEYPVLAGELLQKALDMSLRPKKQPPRM